MTIILDKARELIQVQCELGGGYNHNGVRMILAGMHREHGQAVVDRQIHEFELTMRFGIECGSEQCRCHVAHDSPPVTVTPGGYQRTQTAAALG